MIRLSKGDAEHLEGPKIIKGSVTLDTAFMFKWDPVCVLDNLQLLSVTHMPPHSFA